MELSPAVIAASYGKAPPDCLDALNYVKERLDQLGAIGDGRRWSHLCGQCAHESEGFAVLSERMSYSSAELLQKTFKKKWFPTLASAEPYVRQPRKLANYVYGTRMGNQGGDDGWRYRARGYIGLTGKENYTEAGEWLGVNFVSDPDQASSPRYAWLTAAWYMSTKSEDGKTAFQWAEDNNYEMVTRIINGGINGLEDRIRRTKAAWAAING